jgi:hypothetical protein
VGDAEPRPLCGTEGDPPNVVDSPAMARDLIPLLVAVLLVLLLFRIFGLI